jgi:hypothetical protein
MVTKICSSVGWAEASSVWQFTLYRAASTASSPRRSSHAAAGLEVAVQREAAVLRADREDRQVGVGQTDRRDDAGGHERDRLDPRCSAG